MRRNSNGILRCVRFHGEVCRFAVRHRSYRVLGIETSCDDTAVALLDSNRNVLYSRRLNDEKAVALMGGICPNYFALKHRSQIDELIEDCVKKCRLRLSDLDAVAVTTRPGFIVTLKVGIDTALALAREYNLNFIPVHHMRAHALVMRLLRADLSFPFVALLISGGHSQIVFVRSAEDFEIIGESISGSPGECLDKLARELGLEPEGPHYAPALEKLARLADSDGHTRYPGVAPATPGAQFNFSNVKSNYLMKIFRLRPTESELPNFCASIQFAIMSHLCKKLDAAFQFLERTGRFADFQARNLLVSGGVASNSYLVGCIRRLGKMYDFETLVPPRHLCTDNGEMIAWLGMELLLSNSADVYSADQLPNSIFAKGREPIGTSLVAEVSARKPPRKFKPLILHSAIS